MQYKAIGFDHTGVIAGDSARKFHEKICNILQIERAKFIEAYLHHNLDFNSGKISKKEFWTEILAELHKSRFYFDVMEVVDAPRLLNNQIMELIYDLKKKGYKLGILSNDTKEGAVVIREDEGLDSLFDLILVSAETGLAKPTPEAFLDFVKKLEITPQELVYIDDAKANIAGAEALGIKAIYCEDVSRVRSQLEEIGVI